jgi:predicted RNA-binding protein with PUA-like domain
MKYWIEKTIVQGRPHRQQGDYKLGRVLWSPQTGEGGVRIYENMREIKKDDVVLHFTDNEKFIGISRVQEEHDDSFKGLEGSEWAGRPGYLIKLKEYQELKQPINRNEFLEQDSYRKQLLEIEKDNTVFYTSKLSLRQGAYITEAPEKLLEILNEIYFNKTKEHLPYIDLTNTHTHFDLKEQVIETVLQLLEKKKQIILYGPPGTGKTFLTKRHAVNFLLNKAVNPRKDTEQISNGQNVWIFQTQPQKYKIFDALADQQLPQDRWEINQNSKKIKEGDIAIIWIAGDKSGIYGLADIISDPVTMPDNPLFDKYWINEEDKNQERLRVKIAIRRVLLDNPILKKEIIATNGLEHLSIISRPRGTNFPVREGEWDLIKEIIDERTK